MSLVSVIIPVYNLEKYIKGCVKMFQNQTYADFELIFVNDGSTDKSLEILKSFDDSRIKIFNVEKSNAGMARNFGLNKANGKWIIFFDGDDICEKTFLEKMVQKKVILYAIQKIFGTTKGLEKIHIEDIIKLCNNNIGNKYLTPNKHIKIVTQKKQLKIMAGRCGCLCRRMLLFR